MRKQRTIQSPIEVSGIALHGGGMVAARLQPMDEDCGVVFDVDGVMISAHASNVIDTQLATTLGKDGARVRTVEHLLSTLMGMGIDNVCVTVQGDELPVLDGCAAEWVAHINTAGVTEQAEMVRQIHIRKPVEVRAGERWARLEPAAGMEMDVTIEFDHPLIGQQQLALEVNPYAFDTELSWARTFGFERLVPAMQRMGLVRGGSLDNALVFGDTAPLNEGGLHSPDEPVRHKVLDALGDMALLGYPFVGRLVAERPGHGVVFELVKTTLAQADSHEIW